MESLKCGKYFGRIITEEDLERIRWILETYKSLSRTELIFTISEALEWTRAEDGKPKAWQCRVCLESLMEEGLIELPVADAVASTKARMPTSFLETIPHQEDITESRAIELIVPKSAEENKRWRSYLEHYHTLGYVRGNGVSIRYLIVSGEAELGCMQFASAAWSLEDRDNWIGWNRIEKVSNLRLIANNSRFLLLPWARMPSLASRALGRAARQIQGDWLRTYGYAPALLETFVDSSLYSGTSYRAANWIQVGQTKGRGRYDRHKNQQLTKKLIFVYPLQKDFREVLIGQKPYRRMDI
jgi:hypothetical protein